MSNNYNLITWDEEFMIGDDTIDEEHQMLFVIAKKAEAVTNLSSEKKQKKLLKDIVKELEYYVHLHFTNEEKFMHSINYPNVNDHMKKHQKMLDMLSFMELNLELISVNEINYSLYDFIQNIFVNHIINDDTKIVEYKKEIDS